MLSHWTLASGAYVVHASDGVNVGSVQLKAKRYPKPLQNGAATLTSGCALPVKAELKRTNDIKYEKKEV
jgi:hypothetical protein